MKKTIKQVEENVSPLNLEESHKKWFHPETMGKQRGKPRYDLVEKKKSGKTWKKK